MKKKLMVDKENERRRSALNASITANSDIFNQDTDSDTPVQGWYEILVPKRTYLAGLPMFLATSLIKISTTR